MRPESACSIEFLNLQNPKILFLVSGIESYFKIQYSVFIYLVSQLTDRFKGAFTLPVERNRLLKTIEARKGCNAKNLEGK